MTRAGTGYRVNASFEMVEPCSTSCYVDAATGSDSNSGMAGAPKKTIQAALDTVAAGGTVYVYPGHYDETAVDRPVAGSGGLYQFGLYFAKDGVKLQGVDAAGNPIVGSDANAPYITTNSTSNFGPSGVWVQGNNVVIDGVRIGPNSPDENKTIEIVGDNFALEDSKIDVPGGSVYFNDSRYVATPQQCFVNKFSLKNNVFAQGSTVDISSGAGACTPAADRLIQGNSFDVGATAPRARISFNSSGTTVPWYVHPVGGSVITGNIFQASDQYIRLRGDDLSGTFDRQAYWTDNSYPKAAIALETVVPFKPRAFSYTSGSYVFPSVIRIAGTIQPEITNAQTGDTVLVKNGIYAEKLDAGKSVTIQGESTAGTIVDASAGNGYGISLHDALQLRRQVVDAQGSRCRSLGQLRPQDIQRLRQRNS